MPFAQSLDYVQVEENLSKIDQLFIDQDKADELLKLFAETNDIRKQMGHSRHYRRISDELLKELKLLEDIPTYLAA